MPSLDSLRVVVPVTIILNTERREPRRLLRNMLRLRLPPILRNVPLLLGVLVLVHEPLWVVCELLEMQLIRPTLGTCGRTRTRSRPLMPLLFPADACVSFVLFKSSSSACFLFIRVAFHFANDSFVTGVRFEPSL